MIMNTLRIFFILVLLTIHGQLTSQTVVKMDMPPQADQPIQVIALFDEEIPEGIPVVLGLMGYEIEGGMTPYHFEWMLNGEVISTTDIAVFTPQLGDDLVLKVTDNNVCSASTAFNLKVAGIPKPNTDDNEFVRIFPTVVRNEIQVVFNKSPQQESLVRIFSVSGKLVFMYSVTDSTIINPIMEPGIYFVSVKMGEHHKIEKIIAL